MASERTCAISHATNRNHAGAACDSRTRHGRIRRRLPASITLLAALAVSSRTFLSLLSRETDSHTSRVSIKRRREESRARARIPDPPAYGLSRAEPGNRVFLDAEKDRQVGHTCERASLRCCVATWALHDSECRRRVQPSRTLPSSRRSSIMRDLVVVSAKIRPRRASLGRKESP